MLKCLSFEKYRTRSEAAEKSQVVKYKQTAGKREINGQIPLAPYDSEFRSREKSQAPWRQVRWSSKAARKPTKCRPLEEGSPVPSIPSQILMQVIKRGQDIGNRFRLKMSEVHHLACKATFILCCDFQPWQV